MQLSRPFSVAPQQTLAEIVITHPKFGSKNQTSVTLPMGPPTPVGPVELRSKKELLIIATSPTYLLQLGLARSCHRPPRLDDQVEEARWVLDEAADERQALGPALRICGSPRRLGVSGRAARGRSRGRVDGGEA